MTVRGATVLGIGAMIGAGIFALLGEAGAVAGAAVWISFLLGGIVASLLGYVCVKLGARYPSSGGLITYLIEGFGRGRLVGVSCWLGYIAAVVIVCSMVAVSFGSYATSLFVGDDAAGWWDNLFTTLLILVMVVVNVIGATFVARAQSLIVIGVLAAFADPEDVVHSKLLGRQRFVAMPQADFTAVARDAQLLATPSTVPSKRYIRELHPVDPSGARRAVHPRETQRGLPPRSSSSRR